MSKKTLFLILSMILFAGIANAQYTISGTVTDASDRKPLTGATIILDDQSMITSSDLEGKFIFKDVNRGAHTLKVSYIGFKTRTMNLDVNKDITLSVHLKPEVYFSEEVIISAIRAGDDSPTAYTDIDKATLTKENLGKDLPYLISQTPSVVVTSDAGSGVGYTGLRIRGTDLSGINVTLNGIPVNDPESHQVYFVDLPDLASSVENMQIQRGVGTSTNGAAAFGASINIETDGFSDDPYAEYNVAGGSFNTWKNTFKVGSGILRDHWNFNGRVSWVRSDGYIDRASSDLKSAYFAGGYYGKKDIIKAIVMLGKEKTYQAWYGVPKDSLKTNRTFNPAGEMYDNNGNFLGYYDNQTDNYDQNYYQLHYAHMFSNTLNLTTALFYTKGKGYYESYKNDQKYSDYGLDDFIIGSDTITSTNLIRQKWLDNDFYGAILNLNYEKEKLSFNLGTGWNRYDGDHYGKVIWAEYYRPEDLDKDWYFNNGIKNDFNIFAKGQYKIMDKVSLYLDMQYRYISYNITGIKDDLSDFTQDHYYNFFNPKAGIFYKPDESNSLFFSVAVANREPSRSDFRDADPGMEVKSERLIDFELGYSLNKERFLLEANAFYMDYKDQLVLTGKINNVGSPIRTNVPDSYRTGIELSAALGVTKWLTWNLNGTYSINKIKDFTAYIDDWDQWPVQKEEYLGTTDISFSPAFTGNSILTFNPLARLDLSLVSHYVSRQYIDNTSNKDRSIDPYFVNNIKINYTFLPRFMKSIDLILSLNNIFNTDYETNAWVYRYIYGGNEYVMDGYFPQSGFNFMVGANFKF